MQARGIERPTCCSNYKVRHRSEAIRAPVLTCWSPKASTTGDTGQTHAFCCSGLNYSSAAQRCHSPSSEHAIIFCSKCFSLRFATWIEERPLSDTNDTISKAFAETVIVESCGVEHGAIVPYSYQPRVSTRLIDPFVLEEAPRYTKTHLYRSDSSI